MKRSVWMLATALLWLGSVAQVQAFEKGAELADVTINKKGELRIDNDRISYAPWGVSDAKAGIPKILFHLPARMSSQAIIDPMTERLEAEDFGEDRVQAITVVNLDDAMWGTSGIVASELEKNKRKHPEATIVADDGSRALKAWGLERKATYFILLDADNRVIHSHEGELAQSDIDQFIALIKSQLDEGDTSASAEVKASIGIDFNAK